MQDWTVVSKGVSRPVVTLFTLLVFVMLPAAAKGQNVTAMWDPNPLSDPVTGYEVCISTSSLSCDIGLASVGASETSYTFSPNGGIHTFLAVRAVNDLGPSPFSNEVTFSIPHFTQPPDLDTVVGVATTLRLDFYDPDGGPITFTHYGLPVGLTLNPSTGEITGTPYVVGRYNVSVFAADDLVTVARSWVWTITDGTSQEISSTPTAVSLAITSDLPSPQQTGTPITFTAAVSGGIGPHQYKWWVYTGAAWSLVKDWSTQRTYTWVPTDASTDYQVGVWVRGAGVTGDVPEAYLAVPYPITAPTWGVGESASASVPAGVSALLLTPAESYGASQTFSLQYADSRGAQYLSSGSVWFGDTMCVAHYDTSSVMVGLIDDQGTAWAYGRMGSNATLQNSYCTIVLASSSTWASGPVRTVNLSIILTSPSGGTVWMFAQSIDGLSSGWQDRGTYYVP
jgi:hypothetical protein